MIKRFRVEIWGNSLDGGEWSSWLKDIKIIEANNKIDAKTKTEAMLSSSGSSWLRNTVENITEFTS